MVAAALSFFFLPFWILAFWFLLVGLEVLAFAGQDVLAGHSVATVLHDHFGIGLGLFLFDAICTFLLVFFFFGLGFGFLPVGVGHSATLERPLQHQEEHDRAKADQSGHLVVDLLRTICLRQNVDQSIAHQGPTAQGEQPLYQDAEAGIRAASFAGDDNDGGDEPDQGDSEAGQEPEAPDLGAGELGLVLMVLMVMAVSTCEGTDGE